MISYIKIFCSYSLYFTFFSLFLASEAVLLEFTEHSNHEGAQLSVNVDEGVCYNMPPEWNDRVSHLTTPSEMCLDLFENSGCTGKWKQFRANSYRMYVELGGTEFNDMISSFEVSSRGKNGCEIM